MLRDVAKLILAISDYIGKSNDIPTPLVWTPLAKLSIRCS